MRFKMVYGNIIRATSDCIVNSLGTETDCYGQVCYAILKETKSRELKNYIDGIGYTEPQAMYITDSYGLKAKHIIHIVSPYRWEDDEQCSSLMKSYENVILKAAELGYKSISIPLLGTGANGYECSEAFAAATTIIKKYYDSSLDIKVQLVVYSNENEIYKKDVLGDENRSEKPRLVQTFNCTSNPAVSSSGKLVPKALDMIRINEAFSHYKEEDAFEPRSKIQYPIQFALLVGEKNNVTTKDIYSNSDYEYYHISRFKNGGKELTKMDVFKLAIILKMNTTEFLQFMSYANCSFDSREDIDWRFYTYVMRGKLPSNIQELADNLPSKYYSQIIKRRVS